MSGGRKRRRKGLSLTGLTVLAALCVVMVLFDLYLVMSANAGPRTATTAESESSQDASAPVVSQLPQTIIAAQPEIAEQETAEAWSETSGSQTEWNWENSWVGFWYDEETMWVTEDNSVITVTELTQSTLPRLDMQYLDNAADLTETEFVSLAVSAVGAYFSAEPDQGVVTVLSTTMENGVYETALSVAETSASPALAAYVRLEQGILATMLLPETLDADTQSLWLQVLHSIAP